MFNSCLINLLHHQKALQKDTTIIISKLSDLQIQYKNNHFPAYLHTYDRKADESITDWVTQVEKIAKLTQHPELQLALAKVEGSAYKLIEGMPLSSTWETAKRRLCQVFSPVGTKMHATTRIDSCPKADNETLCEYIQRFNHLVIQTAGTVSTAMTCQVKIFLLFKHLFNKK